MPRSRNPQRGDFTRGKAKPTKPPGPSESDAKLERLNRLPGHQAEALKALEFGTSPAGREFKQHGSEPDTPIVDQPLPMPNESDRTDLDRHGGRDDN